MGLGMFKQSVPLSEDLFGQASQFWVDTCPPNIMWCIHDSIGVSSTLPSGCTTNLHTART